MNARPVHILRDFEPMTVECANVQVGGSLSLPLSPCFELFLTRRRTRRLWPQVGDIVRVSDKEAIPADGILLSSSEDDGSAPTVCRLS